MALEFYIANWQIPRMAMTLVRNARKAKNLTLEKLAEHVGISVSQMSRCERGEREPSFEEVAKMADLLGLKIEDIKAEFGGGRPELAPAPQPVNSPDDRAMLQAAALLIGSVLSDDQVKRAAPGVKEAVRSLTRSLGGLEALKSRPRKGGPNKSPKTS